MLSTKVTSSPRHFIPWQACPVEHQLNFSGKYSAMLKLLHSIDDPYPHCHCLVLICTLRWTEAIYSEQSSEISTRGFIPNQDWECNVLPIALQRPLYVTDLRRSVRVAWTGLGHCCWWEWLWDCCPGVPWRGRRSWSPSSGSCCRLLALQQSTQTHSPTAFSQPQDFRTMIYVKLHQR